MIIIILGIRQLQKKEKYEKAKITDLIFKQWYFTFSVSYFHFSRKLKLNHECSSNTKKLKQ